jgi:hypothetical protein
MQIKLFCCERWKSNFKQEYTLINSDLTMNLTIVSSSQARYAFSASFYLSSKNQREGGIEIQVGRRRSSRSSEKADGV